MNKRTIIVEAYDEKWPLEFEKIKKELTVISKENSLLF